jgi:hypothetical protein
VISFWLSTGTMAPYAITYPDPKIDPECGYLFNPDHEQFKATFLMLDGAAPDVYMFSTVLRRILFPLLSYVPMKLMGFFVGGVLTHFVLHILSIGIFFFYFRRKLGDKPALTGLWLLVTYPGIFYWATLPYCYGIITPCTLMSMILLWELQTAKDIRKALGIGLAFGVLFTGYDLFSFFAPAALFVAGVRKKWSHALALLPGMILPNLLVNVVLKTHFSVDLRNAQTDFYYKLFEAYTTRPDLQKWWLLIKDLPHVFYENFFFGGFLILPVMFLLVLLLTRRKPSLPEVAVMLGGLFVFLICNAAPPLPPGGWSFRGEGVSRLYQPMFIVWVLYLMRQSLQKNLILALIGVAVIAQASIALGPITIHRSADDLYNRFYKHGHPGTMIDNLTRYGRRPLGFCKPPATPS